MNLLDTEYLKDCQALCLMPVKHLECFPAHIRSQLLFGYSAIKTTQ